MPRTLLFDRSDRTRLTFAGPHAVTTLNGLVTNDVAALVPGLGAYAAVLTAKGKIIGDLRLFALPEQLLVDASALAAPGLKAAFTKYVNPRLATMTDVSETMGDLGIFGDEAQQIVATVTGLTLDALDALNDYAHVTADGAYGPLTVARAPELATDGYELFVAMERLPALVQALVDAGAQPVDHQTWDVLRIAAGRPAWGVDMDDNTLPQEANFDELQGVSYTKGCYVGQETVARIHFRGHVNRTLRRLRIDGAHDATHPSHGTELIDTAGTVVGDIRSIARQPDGATLAIGMVRREVETGATVMARWPDGSAPVEILGPANGVVDGAVVERTKGAID